MMTPRPTDDALRGAEMMLAEATPQQIARLLRDIYRSNTPKTEGVTHDA
ncbi:MAG: hypothetical protein AAGF56_10245 [Pseudomonadota bacterium]